MRERFGRQRAAPGVKKLSNRQHPHTDAFEKTINLEMIMSDISTFVDSVYDLYDQAVSDMEDDQKLPPRDILEEVCQVLLNVSCMREEGRFPSFRVCFVSPDSELLDTYIYSHVLLFKEPILFTARELNKLVPALNENMSYLMLDINERPFKAIGIIASYTAWQKIVTRELASGNRMPRIPNIFVGGPGELRLCFGETSIVNYDAGRCVFFRTDIFTSTPIAEELRNGSNISEKERLQLLYRVLWEVGFFEHGATILIVPSEEACEQFIDIKYQLPSRFMFGGGTNIEKPSGKPKEKELVTYADMIAKMTSVDGAVVLTKDLDLLGFGAEVLTDKMGSRHPKMRFIGYDDQDQTYKTFQDNGMRHRAGYRFCSAVPGSVAFVISQDGVIEACTKHDGKVVVYDNVALPMI